MKENRKREFLVQFSDMIDEAIRLGISDQELHQMVEVQYKTAVKITGGGET